MIKNFKKVQLWVWISGCLFSPFPWCINWWSARKTSEEFEMIRFHLKYLGTSGAVELILYKCCPLNCHLILLLPSAGEYSKTIYLRHYCPYVYNTNNLVDLRNFRWYLRSMWYHTLRFSLKIITAVKTSWEASVASSIAFRKLINEEHMHQVCY